MIELVFKFSEILFKLVVSLMIAGVLGTVLCDIQAMAFASKKRGLVSMLSVNQQLVGKLTTHFE